MAHKIKNILFVCADGCGRGEGDGRRDSLISNCVFLFMCVDGCGRGEGDGRRDSLISNCVCVAGWWGWGGEGAGGRDWEGDSLIQSALKNLANKYFHFVQFLILSSVV